MMQGKVLDKKADRGGTCWLVSASLEEYVSSLPDTYGSFELQREIVSNIYLDRLVDTVFSKGHIPPIALVLRGARQLRRDSYLAFDDFRIIDGLQRTFRLQLIRSTIGLVGHSDTTDYLGWSAFKLSRHFASQLKSINSNVAVLRSVLDAKQRHGFAHLLDCFESNIQWFEVWEGIGEQDEIELMLTLNAGHKPVKTRHQLELLFLNLLPSLTHSPVHEFQLTREREISATSFSKARVVGQFHFASIISALLSMRDRAPVTPNTGLIQQVQNEGDETDSLIALTNASFLHGFVRFLVNLDRAIASAFGPVGILWFGREVTLAGVCAAVGAYADRENCSLEDAMGTLLAAVESSPKRLNLSEFEAQRNSVDLSRVNIGKVNRTAVFDGIEWLLSDDHSGRIPWRQLFEAA